MHIFNNKKEHEIRHELNPVVPLMTGKERCEIFTLAKKKKRVCRFYKWIMIGAFTALGFFDMYTWDAATKTMRTENGYVERSVKGHRYDTFGLGFPFILGVYQANGGAGDATYTAPSDWDNNNNWIDLIGGGGAGLVTQAYVYYGNGFGGGGGGYTRRNNVALTRGGTYHYHIGAGGPNNTGTFAENSWFRVDGNNGQPGSYAQGPLAGGGQSAYYVSAGGYYTPGLGGGALYSDVAYSGGNGNWDSWGGGGGGGAGGPHGNGGSGGGAQGTNGEQIYGGGGGGGGGGGNGSTDYQGGNNWQGIGGGGFNAGGASGGGGGGGTGYNSGYSYGSSPGGNGIEYNNGAYGGGGGGGSGWGGNPNGGYYGGGGAGSTAYTTASGDGASGLIVIWHEPAHINFITSSSFAGF